MIRKFITLMMVVAIFSVQAHAFTHNGLKAAVDEMTYALTVEWDQKDPEFYANTMNAFRLKVRQLQSQGLTNSELLELAMAEVKDARVARDIETTFSMITLNRLSEEEAMNHVVETMKRSYGQGANWSGDPRITVMIGLVVVAVIVGLIVSSLASGEKASSDTDFTAPVDSTPQVSPDCGYYVGYTAFYSCSAADPNSGVYQYCLQRTCGPYVEVNNG